MELKAYLAPKAMWNQIVTWTFRRRFMNGYYGAAAPFVKKFWEMGRAVAAAAPVERSRFQFTRRTTRNFTSRSIWRVVAALESG